MIHRTASSWQRIDTKQDTSPVNSSKNDNNDWQTALQQCVTDPEELFSILELDLSYLDAAMQASHDFPLRVPRSFIARMEKGNVFDPLLQQVLPIAEELKSVAGYSLDPVGEQNNPHKGMIQKYHGRALLVINGHCAINCRYCFRRHFPYSENRLSRQEWQQTVDAIANDNTINEVIYSGGDPLVTTDKQLHWLSEQLSQIPHIQRLRIHTRLPVVIPERITPEAIQWMSQTRLQTVMVLHINHANELHDSLFVEKINDLRQAGITLLNQAVLLKGVNDTLEAQVALSESLFAIGIIPYYLHVLDKVAGAAHFDRSHHEAKALHKQLTGHLSGYLVPKLVTEVAGQASKTPI